MSSEEYHCCPFCDGAVHLEEIFACAPDDAGLCGLCGKRIAATKGISTPADFRLEAG